ncbi:MAG: hypothetical protein ACTTHG_02360 [Treponemataceae bacterium]
MKARKPITKKNSEELLPILTYSLVSGIFKVLFHFKSCKAVLCCVKTALTKFFAPQFFVKSGWKRIPVKNVDHELDGTVPFTPLRVKIYLKFITLIGAPVNFLFKRFDKKTAIDYSTQVMNLLEKCYNKSYDIYGFSMTTTDRPMTKVPKKVAANFKTIRKSDPHYMCVPSLHIEIVILAYAFFRKAFSEQFLCGNLTQKEKDFYTKEIYDFAILIAETVLYVKQHSVNCIPAAIYVMRKIAPEIFTLQDAYDFIENLFQKETEFEDVSKEDANKIRIHIRQLFDKFIQEEKTSQNWEDPIKRWIVEYVPTTFKNSKNLEFLK